MRGEAPSPGASETRVAEGGGRARLRRRVGVVIGSTLLLAAITLALLRSPLFAADRLIVEGANRLPSGRVLRLAGITPGENVVWFDADEARRNLEADPWIADAEVHTDLPDAIAVRITERVAVGAIETHAGWEVLAADGVILATPADRPNLPSITAVVPGDDVVKLGAGVLGALSPDLRRGVESLTVGTDGLVQLALRRGVIVTYGGADEAEEKAQALAAVVAWAEEEHAHVQQIDVSVPGAPTARLVGGRVAHP